jgi:hypothetical protein
MLIVFSAGTGIFLVTPSFVLVYAKKKDLLPARLVTIVDKVKNSMVLVVILGVYLLCSYVSLLVFSFALFRTFNDTWTWGLVPLFLPFDAIILLIIGPLMWIMFFPGRAVVYAFKGYLHIGSNVSESCFFMPYAPQSISDEDQMYAAGGSILLLRF